MGFFEVEADIFDLDVPAIGHGCNCQGVMGAGIAVEFRRRWPRMYDYYAEFCADGDATPGDFFPYEDDNGRVIYNLFTQVFPGAHAHLDYIRAAVEAAITDCQERGIRSLAIPRIGAGIGGLRWSDVRQVLRDISIPIENFTLYAVTLPPAKGEPHDDVSHLSRYPHPLYKVEKWGNSSAGEMDNVMKETSLPEEADIITSKISDSGSGKEGMHTIMLDLDVPATLVPSSTPGHSHLYIDVPVFWKQYEEILTALGKVHVLESGYVRSSLKRGYTSLRLPWISK